MNRHNLVRLARATPLLLAALACGCISRIEVKRATDGSPGIRYFLPQVFIQITPNNDGSFEVKPVYLPDPASEYTIEANSYLGSYTLDINRSEKGFLETVSFNSDSTGAAKQLITSQASLRTAEVTAAAAKAKEAATTAKADADKKAAAVAAADQAREGALLSLQLAQDRLEILEKLTGAAAANKPDDLQKQILAAKIAVAEAKRRYESAARTSEGVEFGGGSVMRSLKAWAPNGAASSSQAERSNSPTLPKAPTPAFLLVVMTKDGVELKQGIKQQDIASWTVPDAPRAVLPLALRSDSLTVRPAEKTGALTMVLKANRSLQSAQVTSILLPPGLDDLVEKLRPSVTLQPDLVTVLVDFRKSMPKGDYTVKLRVDGGTRTAPVPEVLEFEVRIER